MIRSGMLGAMGCQSKMAFFLDDVPSRRTRALILDARASMEAVPEVARVMAGKFGKDEAWQKEQVKRCLKLDETYPVIE